MDLLENVVENTVRSRIRMAVWCTVLVLGVGCAREPVDKLVADGQAALRAGDYRSAAADLRRAARHRPNSAVLHYNLGMAEMESRRYRQAVRAFDRAATLTTDDATDALEGLARVRQLQGRWSDARTAYEKAVEKAGRMPRFLAGMAACEIKTQNPEAALKLLSEALLHDIDEPVALFNMGFLQRDAFDDRAAAAAYFARFLSVAPANEKVRGEKALEELGEVLPAASARAEALIMQSRQATNGDEAIAFAAQAVEEDPISADALWNLCGTLARQGAESDHIVRTYAQFARKFPADSRRSRIPTRYHPVRAERALASARTAANARRWKDAVTAYRQALAFDDRDPAAWLGLSQAAQHLPDLETSLEAATRAVTLQSGNAQAVYQLGTVQHLLGRRAAALENFQRYLQMIPDGPHKESVIEWLNKLE